MFRPIGTSKHVLLAAMIGLAVAAAAPTAARAQGRSSRRGSDTGPGYWVGLSYGFIDGTTISDGNSGDTWQFGYTSQIRATLEKTMDRNFAIGVAAGFSTAPMTFSSSATSPINTGCLAGCAANADITQYLGYIRSGGGLGFHGLFSLEGGATEFSRFRDKANGASLPPTGGTYDFTIGFGGGIGYGVSTISEIYAEDQYDFVLHPEGANTTTSAPRLMVIRVGGRIGF